MPQQQFDHGLRLVGFWASARRVRGLLKGPDQSRVIALVGKPAFMQALELDDAVLCALEAAWSRTRKASPRNDPAVALSLSDKLASKGLCCLAAVAASAGAPWRELLRLRVPVVSWPLVDRASAAAGKDLEGLLTALECAEPHMTGVGQAMSGQVAQ